MAVLTKDAFLKANDLEEKEIELPTIGGSVKIRALPAAYSAQASSEAMEVTMGARGQQSTKLNTARLEELQVFHALVEPKLGSVEEARTFLTQCGPAARTLIDEIVKSSGLNQEALEDAQTRFPGVGDGTPNGGSAQSVPGPAGSK